MQAVGVVPDLLNRPQRKVGRERILALVRNHNVGNRRNVPRRFICRASSTFRTSEATDKGARVQVDDTKPRAQVLVPARRQVPSARQLLARCARNRERVTLTSGQPSVR